MNLRLSGLVAVVLLTLVATTAAAEEPSADAEAKTSSDTGIRFHLTSGYPALFGAGIGYKTEFGTEFMVQGGAAAVWTILAATAETSVSQELSEWNWGLAHMGLAASYVHAHFFVIDCYPSEEDAGPCEDTIQKIWWFGPRLGVRGKFYPKRPKNRLYLEVNGGPMIGFCGEDCVEEIPAGLAVQLRAVFDAR